MASDTEDEDLESLRLAALKTMQKAQPIQPIQKVISVSTTSRLRGKDAWQDFPQHATVPEIPTPRAFRPRGSFNQGNRGRPFQPRHPHRTFGDRNRPLFDKGGRFPRQAYNRGAMSYHRGRTLAYSQPSVPNPQQRMVTGGSDMASGNLIIINRNTDVESSSSSSSIPKDEIRVSANSGATVEHGPCQDADKHAQLKRPQDKCYKDEYHKTKVADESTKNRDKFSRYDSDQSEDEDDVNVNEITDEIDRFLNDCDTDEQPTTKPVDQLETKSRQPTTKTEVENLLTKTVVEEKVVRTIETDNNAEEDDLDDLASPVESDAESLDLDALASGGIIFEEVEPSNKDVRVKDKINHDNIGEIKTVDDLSVSHSSESKPAVTTKSSNSKTPPSSDPTDSSGNGGKDEKHSSDIKITPVDNTNADETLSLQRLVSHADIDLSILVGDRSPSYRSTSPISPGSLSPLLNKDPDSPFHKSPNVSRKSFSPRQRSSPRRRSVSPRRKFSPRRPSISPRRQYSPSYYSSKKSSLSPKRTITSKRLSSVSPSKRSSMSPGRDVSPLRHSNSPRRRHRSPYGFNSSQRSRSPDPRSPPRRKRLNSLSPYKRNNSPVHRVRSPLHMDRRRERGYDRDSGRLHNYKDRRQRSRSQDRHRKATEVKPAEDSHGKKDLKNTHTGIKNNDDLAPSQNLDKLTPEERKIIEARQKKFSSNEVTIDPSKKVSLKSIKERPKKPKKPKNENVVDANEKMTGEAKKVKSNNKKEKKKVKEKGTVDVSIEDDDEESDSGARSWRTSGGNVPGQTILLSKQTTSKPALVSLDSLTVSREGFGTRRSQLEKRHERRTFDSRTTLERRKPVPNIVKEEESNAGSTYGNRLTSSVVRAKPFKANIPTEKLSIEIQVSRKEKQSKQTKSTAKPDFSQVYSVPAKRHIVEPEIEEKFEEEEDDGDKEVVPLKKAKKVKKKKKKHSEEKKTIEWVGDDIDEYQVLKSCAKEEPESLPTAPRPSIMDRLGKKVDLGPEPDLEKKEEKKEKKKKKKKTHSNDAEQPTDLDVKIERIKKKNEAIARRQREIEKDKQMYG